MDKKHVPPGLVIVAGLVFLAIPACGVDTHGPDTPAPNPTNPPYSTSTSEVSPTQTSSVIVIPAAAATQAPLLGIKLQPGYKIDHLVKPPLVSPSDVEIGPDDAIYVTEWNGKQVLRVDRDGTISPYVALEVPSGIKVTSAGEVFAMQGEELVKISSEGERTVIAQTQSPASWGLGPNDDLFFLVGEELIRFAADGSRSTILTGLQASGDMAISPSGEIYIADWPRGRIIKIDLEGRVSTVADGFVYDAFNIAFDRDGNLYQNQDYLTQVSLVDGSRSSPFLKEFNVVLNSRPFAFDSSGDVILVGPTTNNLFRASFEDGQVLALVGGPGNSYGLAVGPGGDIFLGASNEFPVEPGKVVRIAPDGTITDYAAGFTTVKDILFDEDGNMYVSDVDYGGVGGGRIIKITPEGTPSILFSGFYDLNNMIYDAAKGEFLAFDNNSRQLLLIKGSGEVTPVELDLGGEIYTIEITPDLEDGYIAMAVFKENIDIGPVHRGLYQVTADYQTTFLADIDTPLATTEDDIFVHPSGDIYIVGPEAHPVFRMLRVTRQGEVSVFAGNLPYDTLSLTISDAGEIYFTCSAGLFRITEAE